MTGISDPRRVLAARLARIHARVADAVARRRTGPSPDDAFRGLYISEEDVDALLASGPPSAGDIEEPGDGSFVSSDAPPERSRLRHLERVFGLTALDLEVLLVALAPDVDARFERLYGYLHDDVTRRRPSIGLALELAGASPTSPGARERFAASAPLRRFRLLHVDDRDRPFLTRSLRVPDRVTDYLLGSDVPDPTVERLCLPTVPVASQEAAGVARAVESGAWLCYVRERPGAAGWALGVAAFQALGAETLAVDLSRLSPDEDPVEVTACAVREAALEAAGVVLGPAETLVRDLRALDPLVAPPTPVVLLGAVAWEPTWAPVVPFVVEAPVPDPLTRHRLWQELLDGEVPDAGELATETATFRLTPEQTLRAAVAAKLQAVATGVDVGRAHLRAGARTQNAGRLEALARRIEPRVSFSDVVLPPDVIAQLREIVSWARHRDEVLEVWGMGGKGTRGRGVTALFAGDSGTGKTLSAEAIAGELGLDLYAIDLSTVVDKYIGETEKNLERIFSEAEGVNGVLFFDEADALFGKRSEVSDARDRHANVEVAYLLQRMEQFEGIAVLATNLRANLDEAFTRRLDTIVHFPDPDQDQRRSLWALHLPPSVPRSDDVDLDYLAKAFDLAGGDIRNITLAAAHLAAAAGRPLLMADLVRATAREYRKLGRLCTASEFGPYLSLLRETAPAPHLDERPQASASP